MNLKRLASLLKRGFGAFAIFILMFGDGFHLSYLSSSDGFLRKFRSFCLQEEIQWMVFLCLFINSFTLLIVQRLHKPLSLLAHQDARAWLAWVMAIGSVNYALNYTCALHPAQALVWITGSAVGLGTAFLTGCKYRIGYPCPLERGKFEAGDKDLRLLFQLGTLTIFLTAISVWNFALRQTYSYRMAARWSNPWDNPNIFGLMMGTGVVFAAGLIVQILVSNRQSWGIATASRKSGSDFWPKASGSRGILRVSFIVLAVVVLVNGLVHSYSRGAWCSTGTALVYLAWYNNQYAIVNRHCCFNVFRSFLLRNWISASVILASVCLLCFWQFRQTGWHPLMRAYSAVNAVDFSWRNRVYSWEGALQITVENPFLGAGWNQPEKLYDHYYISPKLENGAAIEMNDYLLLGATIGVPALFCFGMYGWLTLRGPGSRLWALGSGRDGGNDECRMKNEETGREESGVRSQEAEWRKLEWLQTTCHAGAIVLLVGFWFDGGLFKLPTAATFWILLELGAVQPQNRLTAKNSKIPENCAA